MKRLVFLISSFLFLSNTGCIHREPEFTIDGVGYYTVKNCVKDTSWTEYCYHYGYDYWKGEFRWHWGYDQKSECLEYVTDTIAIEEQ